MGRPALLSPPSLIVVLPLLLSACARPNPAFDERERSEGSEGDGDGDADTLGTGKDEGEEASGDGDGDGDSETNTGDGDGDGDPISDLPDEACPWRPEPGLAIRVGSPADFGGQCPTSINATTAFLEGGGGEVSLSTCDPECEICGSDFITLSADPLIVSNYIPNVAGQCLRVRAESPLGGDATGCYWGSVSVRNWETQKPYIIATTRSAPPPTDAASLVEALIPAPLFGGTCDCGQVGLGGDRCCLDSDPPEFWYYPIEGQELFAGDSIEVLLQNANLSLLFAVFQAERIADCNANDSLPQLSWALTDLP